MTISTTILAEDIRDWLGLKATDVPSDAILTKHINWALVPIEYEINTTDQNTIDYSVLLKVGSQIMKLLARKSVKNGYIEFNGTGINIKKSPTELLELATDLETDYNNFLMLNVSEVEITTYLDNVSSRTQQDFKDMWQGTSNAWDYQSKNHPGINRQNEVLNNS